MSGAASKAVALVTQRPVNLSLLSSFGRASERPHMFTKHFSFPIVINRTLIWIQAISDPPRAYYSQIMHNESHHPEGECYASTVNPFRISLVKPVVYLTTWIIGLFLAYITITCNIDELVKSHQDRWQSRDTVAVPQHQLQGAQILRNEAYLTGTLQWRRMRRNAADGLFTKPSFLSMWKRLWSQTSDIFKCWYRKNKSSLPFINPVLGA